MKSRYKTILALTIYILSVGALTLSDFFVVKFFNENDIAQWAFYKSLIFICGGICVLGFDQLLLREVDKYIAFKKQFLIQSLIVSSFISIALYFYHSNIIQSIQIFIILFLFSLFMFEAGYYRGKSNLIKAQINTNLWKMIIFFALIVATLLDKKSILTIYFSTYIICFTVISLINRKDISVFGSVVNLTQVEKIKYFYMGLYFFVHSFSLVIANYGEQFIINIFQEDAISSTIFTYITLYSSVVLASIGFIGFYLGPKVRYSKEFNLKDYKKYQSLVLLSSIMFTMVNSVVAWLVYPYFFSKLGFDFLLWSLIIVLTLCRASYVLPSLCLGVFGTEDDLKRTSFYSLLAVAAYIAVFTFLMYFNLESKIYCIVVLMIIHWLTKIYISNFFTKKIFNRNLLA